jgi:hypothetical protein
VAPIGLLFGSLLILLGGTFYVITEMASPTALIPAAFGVLLLLLGALAARGSDRMRMHTMHAAALVGLIGAVMPIVMIILRSATMSPAALWENVLMAVLSAVFVALCIKSFIDARRRRGGMGTGPEAP